MLIEMHFTKAALESAVDAKLRQYMPVDFDVLDLPIGPVVVDHVEILKSELIGLPAQDHVVRDAKGAMLGNAKGDSIGLETKVRVHVGKLGDVAGDHIPADKLINAGELTLKFRVYADTAPQDSLDPASPLVGELRVEFAGVGGTLKYPLLDTALKDAFKQVSFKSEVDVSALEGLLGVPSPMKNIGLAAWPDLSIVSLRIEVVDVPSDAVARWANFFNGQWGSNLGTLTWALQIDKELMKLAARKRVNEAIAEMKDYDHESGPSVGWGFAQTGGTDTQLFGIVGSFEGALVDACPMFGIDIGVEIFIDAGFKLGTGADGGPVLDTRTSVTWNLIDSDVLWCGFASGGVLGAGIGAIIGGKVGGAVGLLVGAVVGPIAFAIIADNQTASQSMVDAMSQGSCSVQPSDQSESIETLCSESVVVPGGALFGDMSPSELVTTGAGLTLRGAFPAQAKSLKSSALKVHSDSVQWSSKASCSSMNVQSWLGTGRVTVSHGGGAPLSAHCIVRNDALGILQVKPSPTGIASIASFAVTIDESKLTAYHMKPYPFEFLILTNYGARVLTWPELARRPKQKMTEAERIKFIANCKARQHPFWNGSRYNPKWDVDPPYEHDHFLQHWRILIDGLAKGENVLFEHVGGAVSAKANAKGAAIIDVTTKHQEVPTVVRSGKRKSSRRSAAGGRMAMQQTLMARQALIPLVGKATSLHAVEHDGRAYAVVCYGRRAVVYDASSGSPQPVLRLAKANLDGIGQALRRAIGAQYGPDAIARIARGVAVREKPGTVQAWLHKASRSKAMLLSLEDAGRKLALYRKVATALR